MHGLEIHAAKITWYEVLFLPLLPLCYMCTSYSAGRMVFRYVTAPLLWLKALVRKKKGKRSGCGFVAITCVVCSLCFVCWFAADARWISFNLPGQVPFLLHRTNLL